MRPGPSLCRLFSTRPEGSEMFEQGLVVAIMSSSTKVLAAFRDDALCDDGRTAASSTLAPSILLLSWRLWYLRQRTANLRASASSMWMITLRIFECPLDGSVFLSEMHHTTPMRLLGREGARSSSGYQANTLVAITKCEIHAAVQMYVYVC